MADGTWLTSGDRVAARIARVEKRVMSRCYRMMP
jgi:hypothetical protein